MKRWLALLITLGILLSASALAETEGHVTASSCSIIQSGDYTLLYCFAQIHNDSDAVICLDEGSFFVRSGEQLLAQGDAQRLWPYFLNPGEDGYLSEVVVFEPDENGAPSISVTGIEYDLSFLASDIAYAGYDLQTVTDMTLSPDGSLEILCEAANGTETTAFDASLGYGVYDENGTLLYADGLNLQNIGIAPENALLLRLNVDSGFVDQWQLYGVKPAEVRVNAAFRQDDD